jgi:hypothetical protein
MTTYWLSMHVPYACRHSGVCCSSGWTIPIEHTRTGPVAMLRADGSWLLPAPDAPPDVAGTIAVTGDGHCVFHRDGCEIQRAYGHQALPTACRHFPREVLIDGRGASVTLSHYCPTALDLLVDHVGPVTIVPGPPAVPTGDPEGLDAREVLPPLLTDGVLMDLDGYAAWEAHMVRVLTAEEGGTPEQTLETLEDDLAIVQRWRPGRRSLADEISRLAMATDTAAGGLNPHDTAGPGLHPHKPVGWGMNPHKPAGLGLNPHKPAGLGLNPHKPAGLGLNPHKPVGWGMNPHKPAGLGLNPHKPAGPGFSPGMDDVVIRRYLAARAFASWMAYEAGGVAAVLRSLWLVLSVLRERRVHLPLQQAIAQTDLHILHLMPRDALVAKTRVTT